MAVSRAVSGKNAALLVGAASSASGTEFGAARNYEFTATHDAPSFAHVDTSGYMETIDGLRSWRFTAEAVYLSTTATVNEQDTIRNGLLNGTRLWWQFNTSTASGGSKWAGWGYVTSWSLSGSVDNIWVHNFEITGDGKYTETA